MGRRWFKNEMPTPEPAFIRMRRLSQDGEEYVNMPDLAAYIVAIQEQWAAHGADGQYDAAALGALLSNLLTPRSVRERVGMPLTPPPSREDLLHG